jgi:hypothetical protein
MEKVLKISFQGVVALIPNAKFKDAPTRVKVVMRNLVKARTIRDETGKDHIVDGHHAWLELPGDVPFTVEGPALKLVTVQRDGGPGLQVKLLQKQAITIQPDGHPLDTKVVKLDASLLDHLAVYPGALKDEVLLKEESGDDSVSAWLELTGGTLATEESTEKPYLVTRADGKEATIGVATMVSWSVRFDKEIVLLFAQDPTRPALRLRPQGNLLHLTFRHREMSQLLLGPTSAFGGRDDPEFLVYGDSIKGGQPRLLRSAIGNIPAGRKACGLGGIQS